MFDSRVKFLLCVYTSSLSLFLGQFFLYNKLVQEKMIVYTALYSQFQGFKLTVERFASLLILYFVYLFVYLFRFFPIYLYNFEFIFFFIYLLLRGLSKKFIELVNKNKSTSAVALSFLHV